MTDQPTTWTSERALAMFKDWDDPDLTIHEFCEKWYVSHNPDDFARIAITALESAAAEIAKQKAQADAAEKETEVWRAGGCELAKDVKRLRADLAAAKVRVAELEAEKAELVPLSEVVSKLKKPLTGPTGRCFSLSSVECEGGGMPLSVRIYGTGDMGPGEVARYVREPVAAVPTPFKTVEVIGGDSVDVYLTPNGDDIAAASVWMVRKSTGERIEFVPKPSAAVPPVPQSGNEPMPRLWSPAANIGEGQCGQWVELQWWCGERSLTLFLNTDGSIPYLKSWGVGSNEMEDGQVASTSFADLWRWLNTEPKPVAEQPKPATPEAEAKLNADWGMPKGTKWTEVPAGYVPKFKIGTPLPELKPTPPSDGEPVFVPSTPTTPESAIGYDFDHAMRKLEDPEAFYVEERLDWAHQAIRVLGGVVEKLVKAPPAPERHKPEPFELGEFYEFRKEALADDRVPASVFSMVTRLAEAVLRLAKRVEELEAEVSRGR